MNPNPSTQRTAVLLLARELHLGGSERQMAEIAQVLGSHGFEAHIGCFHTGGLRYDQLRNAGLRMNQFKIHSYASTGAVTGIIDLVRYVRSQKIRIVHAWDYPTAVSSIPVTRLFTRAVAVSSQRGHRELIPNRYRALARMSDRFSHGIIVNCEFLKKHLVEDERVPARKVRLCYNGVDIERFCRIPGPKLAPLRNSSLVVGTACALRPEKDLHTLIEGFARTRSALPGMTLVIVGDGPELRSLQQHALLAGVAHACHFQPAIPDVVPWLSAIDIFVLGSRTEAFSNALMEAMACRCCVIASNVGGNPELVRNEETGLLFSPGDPAALAETLFRVINDPGLRLRLAARAEDEIRSKFSISTAAAHMAAIYSSFLSASRSSS